jgi:hypothetical protein
MSFESNAVNEVGYIYIKGIPIDPVLIPSKRNLPLQVGLQESILAYE